MNNACSMPVLLNDFVFVFIMIRLLIVQYVESVRLRNWVQNALRFCKGPLQFSFNTMRIWLGRHECRKVQCTYGECGGTGLSNVFVLFLCLPPCFGTAAE